MTTINYIYSIPSDTFKTKKRGGVNRGGYFLPKIGAARRGTFFPYCLPFNFSYIHLHIYMFTLYKVKTIYNRALKTCRDVPRFDKQKENFLKRRAATCRDVPRCVILLLGFVRGRKRHWCYHSPSRFLISLSARESQGSSTSMPSQERVPR